jgi:hypothetical protein
MLEMTEGVLIDNPEQTTERLLELPRSASGSRSTISAPAIRA